MDRIKSTLFVSLIGLSAMLLPRFALAATPTITMTQSPGVQRAGDTIVIQVSVDSAGQNINAVQAVIKYAPMYLEPVSVTEQKQFWPLWPQEPSWDNTTGTLTLEGGRPNGVVAVQAPFADITFRVKAGGLTQLVLDTAASGFYLNDNHGTKISVTSPGADLALADTLVPIFALDRTTVPTPNTWVWTDQVHIGWAVEKGMEYSYSWATNSQAVPDGRPQSRPGSLTYDHLADGIYYWTVESRTVGGLWSRISQFRFQIDQTPPTPFKISKLDPRVVGGNMVISWQASDATSGVASTHLLVGKKDLGEVRSPLQLRSEWAGSTLTIVVRDQAGNEQRSSWVYQGFRASNLLLGGMAVVIIGLLLTLLLLRRRRR